MHPGTGWARIVKIWQNHVLFAGYTLAYFILQKPMADRIPCARRMYAHSKFSFSSLKDTPGCRWHGGVALSTTAACVPSINERNQIFHARDEYSPRTKLSYSRKRESRKVVNYRSMLCSFHRCRPRRRPSGTYFWRTFSWGKLWIKVTNGAPTFKLEH